MSNVNPSRRNILQKSIFSRGIGITRDWKNLANWCYLSGAPSPPPPPDFSSLSFAKNDSRAARAVVGTVSLRFSLIGPRSLETRAITKIKDSRMYVAKSARREIIPFRLSLPLSVYREMRTLKSRGKLQSIP